MEGRYVPTAKRLCSYIGCFTTAEAYNFPTAMSGQLSENASYFVTQDYKGVDDFLKTQVEATNYKLMMNRQVNLKVITIDNQ